MRRMEPEENKDDCYNEENQNDSDCSPKMTALPRSPELGYIEGEEGISKKTEDYEQQSVKE